MDIHRAKYIFDELSAFSYGQFQDFTAFYTVASKAGIDMEEVVEVVRRLNSMDEFSRLLVVSDIARARYAFSRQSRKCPECGGDMAYFNGDDNDGQWVCRCRYGIYEPRSLNELLEIFTQEARRDIDREINWKEQEDG